MPTLTVGTAVVTRPSDNLATHTSHTANLATTTVGDINLIELTQYAAASATAPNPATPAGWTRILQGVAVAGGSEPMVSVYWRRFQAGDASTVTFTWTVAGSADAVCTPISGADAADPFPYSVYASKTGSNTTYTIAGTTGSDPGVLLYGFGNRNGTTVFTGTSGDTVRAAADTSRTNGFISLMTASPVAASTAFSKSATGANTSIGTGWAIIVKAASGTEFSGSAAWSSGSSMSGTLTAQPASAAFVSGSSVSAAVGSAVGAAAWSSSSSMDGGSPALQQFGTAAWVSGSGMGADASPVAGSTSPAIPGSGVGSVSAWNNTNTSLDVALESTTEGDVNLIVMTGFANGNLIDPDVTIPAGWTPVAGLDFMDTNGTPASYAIGFWRRFVPGDLSTVTVTWTNQGQMVADCLKLSNVADTDGLTLAATAVQATTSQQFTVAGTMPSKGILITGAANRTGTSSGSPWNHATLLDQFAGESFLGSASCMIQQVTADELEAGDAFTRTFDFLGAGTSVGVAWAVVVAGAAVAGSGPDAAWTSGSSMVPTGVGAGAGSLTFASGSSAMAGFTSPLAAWLAQRPLYVAHRGGGSDWPEMTMFAYANAVANGATAINVDGWMTSDGVWVASHDQTTGRVFGTNLDIPTNTWATLSTLRTTVGNQPICRVVDVLALYGGSQIIFAENKHSASLDTSWFNLLDANVGPGRCVAKQYYTAGQAATDAHARGYTTWGYYYEADLTNLTATQSRWDLLGMDYLASQSAWNTIKALGRPVIGHVIDTAAEATTAFSKGADGVMTSKVLGVIPNIPQVTAGWVSGSVFTGAFVPQDVAAAWSSGSSMAAAAGPLAAMAAFLSGSSMAAAGAGILRPTIAWHSGSVATFVSFDPVTQQAIIVTAVSGPGLAAKATGPGKINIAAPSGPATAAHADGPAGHVTITGPGV